MIITKTKRINDGKTKSQQPYFIIIHFFQLHLAWVTDDDWCSPIRWPFISMPEGWQASHTHRFLLSQSWNWDFELNGFFGGGNLKGGRSPWDVSIEDVYIAISVEVCAIPGDPCYQILKMLSDAPRLPTRHVPLHTLPSSLFRFKLPLFLSPFPYIDIINMIHPHYTIPVAGV